MIKSKKQMYLVIGAFAIVLTLFTTTYAFFNYTRTGSRNTIRVGRIAFNSTQDGTINLTNVFPIKSSDVATDTTNSGEVTVAITGDTTYSEGVEYLITTSDVNITTNGKTVPVSLAITPTSLGTASSTYWDSREDSASSIYKVLSSNSLENNGALLVGYIASGAEGVNGNIKVKAYIDADRIAISDTYDGTESDNMGTTSYWVNDRVVLTTTEWNALQSNGISFKIKVEANEGIWVEPIETLGDKIISRVGNDGIVAINTSGALASGSDTIREYRYSGGGRYCTYTNTSEGKTYNLQVDGDTCPETTVFGGGPPSLYTTTADIKYYNNSGNDISGTTYTLASDGVQEGTVKNYISFNNELWRIIGVFDGKVKIMKDVPIKTSESYMADDGTNGVRYTGLNNTTYQIKQYFGNYMANNQYAPIAWNSDYSNTGNNWAEAGLQYWLNESKTGSYFNTISAAYRNLIQDDTYYLSNVWNGSWGTASAVYNDERATAVECAASVTSNSHSNSCNLWNGNEATWTGKVALPYPSDFGYASASTNWSTSIGSYWDATNNPVVSDNWFLNNEAYINWFLSPSSDGTQYVPYWGGAGYMYISSTVTNYFAVRPVLNLASSLIIASGDGSYTSPYTIKLS